MPFVRISLSSDHDAASARAIADAVHEAMVAAIGIPADDRFQAITKHGDGDLIWDRGYLGVQRSDTAVFVQIFMSAGRDDAKKRALYARIVRNVTERTRVRAQDVLIVISENTRVDWSLGDGIAQYVPG